MKLKMNSWLISLVVSIILITALHFFTFNTRYCGFEGCTLSAGFPLNYFQATGLGGSSLNTFAFAIDFAIIYFPIFFGIKLIKKLTSF